MKTLLQSLRVVAVLTLLTGLAYPFAVWGSGRVLFPAQAEGSLLRRQNRIVGSALLAQKTTAPGYFHPRPSAGEFATVASAASNQAWTSAKLAAAVADRRTEAGAAVVPADLLTASGSGLDPEVSLAAIRFQEERVARARALTDRQRQTLEGIIAQLVEGGQLSPVRVNVLRLNLALDAAFPP